MFVTCVVFILPADAIYCAHGGIPRSAQTIGQINQIKKELVNPETESAIAWEVLNSIDFISHKVHVFLFVIYPLDSMV